MVIVSARRGPGGLYRRFYKGRAIDGDVTPREALAWLADQLTRTNHDLSTHSEIKLDQVETWRSGRMVIVDGVSMWEGRRE